MNILTGSFLRVNFKNYITRSIWPSLVKDLILFYKSDNSDEFIKEILLILKGLNPSNYN